MLYWDTEHVTRNYPYLDCIALKHCQNEPGNKHLRSRRSSGFSAHIARAQFQQKQHYFWDIPAWIYHTGHYLSLLLLIT